MRLGYLTLGWLMLGLGAIGAAVPLLPTTVFLIAAAWCFARSSPRLHARLMAHPRFGPPLADWRAHGAIRPDVKRLALGGMAGSFALSLALGVGLLALLAQGAALAAAAAFVMTRPDGPRD